MFFFSSSFSFKVLQDEHGYINFLMIKNTLTTFVFFTCFFTSYFDIMVLVLFQFEFYFKFFNLLILSSWILRIFPFGVLPLIIFYLQMFSFFFIDAWSVNVRFKQINLIYLLGIFFFFQDLQAREVQKGL